MIIDIFLYHLFLRTGAQWTLWSMSAGSAANKHLQLIEYNSGRGSNQHMFFLANG